MTAPVESQITGQSAASRRWAFALPLIIFAVVLGFLFKGLFLNPRELPSVLIGKPAPNFMLPQVADRSQTFSRTQMLGKVWIVNVWGSWCAACRIEHPLFVELAKKKIVPILGFNWKDEQADALGWLARYGNPYDFSVSDLDGKIAIDFGVYGAPETFIIDKAGVIAYKFIGPISTDVLEREMLPLIKTLQAK